jgi:hypothetical protein
MKRKNYFSFLFPRLVIALLIAAVVFSISQATLVHAYNSAIDSGWNRRRERYESLVRSYAEGKNGDVFIDILTNFFTADYYRFAEVREDGSFNTIAESDYKSLPMEDEMRHWYYVTNDKDLLAKGKRTEIVSNNEWTIEYKKCDEAWRFKDYADTSVVNSWDLAAQSDLYLSNMLFTLALDYSGYSQYRSPVAQTFYAEGDTLHLGKVVESFGMTYETDKAPFYAKKWDFTDASKADRYISIDSGGFQKDLLLFPVRIRPDEFLKSSNGLFLANSMSELQKAYELREDYKDENFEALFKEFAENKRTDGRYRYTVNEQSLGGCGAIDFYKINGKLYVVEFIIKDVPADYFFRPFYIVMAVFLALAAVVTSLLVSIKPYSQYKKAYENNIFKNNLIDSLAHNMKTPLQILGGYAENLKDVKGEEEKDRYADQILAKTTEMNKDIEAILKTAEKSDRKFAKESVRVCVDEVASKLGAEVFAKGDMKIRMDKDYFKTAIYCLLDNAMKYKSDDSKIEIDITCKSVTIRNKTGKDKFTPGMGIAIAGRILEQHKLRFRTTLKDGVFEARFGKNLGKEKKK